jgi:hypothetical protein
MAARTALVAELVLQLGLPLPDVEALLHRFEHVPLEHLLHPRAHRLPHGLDAPGLLLCELHVERRELLRRGLVDRFEGGGVEREVTNGAALLVRVRGTLRDLPLLLLADLGDACRTLLD